MTNRNRSKDNIEILTKLPMRGKFIAWSKIKMGSTININHKEYGFLSFQFVTIDNKNGKSLLHLKYNNNTYTIHTSDFVTGGIRGIIGEFTKDYKIKLGALLKDDKRDISIIDRELRKNKHRKNTYWKYYKYHCNICGYEGWIEESHLIGKSGGCSCCNGHSAILGINTIYDTDPWLIELGISEKDAKKYTKGSSKYIEVTCPDCGNKKKIKISSVYRNKSIGCICGDGFSYPEKFMFNVLTQLDVEFITQLSRTVFKWCKDYRYDIYIPKYNMIIETNGLQHYKETSFKMSLQETQENDKFKKELALNNGIKHYIVIDCRISDVDFIKENILKSKLNKFFDLSSINWVETDLYAIKNNKIKEVCDYWNQKEDWETVGTMGRIFNRDRSTIRDWLKKGNRLGWCNYNTEEEKIKNYKNKLKRRAI